jgi:hypothetical protein
MQLKEAAFLTSCLLKHCPPTDSHFLAALKKLAAGLAAADSGEQLSSDRIEQLRKAVDGYGLTVGGLSQSQAYQAPVKGRRTQARTGVNTENLLENIQDMLE